MTSRVSFLKLVIETFRRHIAAVLITVLSFLIYIIAFFMNIQNILNTHVISDNATYGQTVSDIEYIKERLIEICSPNLLIAFMAGVIGIYLAFDFFRYLHSKKETDFYESLPLTRQKQFLVRLTASFSVFFILTLITGCLQLGIVFGTGLGSSLIFKNMLWTIVCMLGIFLVGYVTTVLAMVMTGHIIIAFLGFCLMVSYIPLILAYLIPVYGETFFETYIFPEYPSALYYFSPITLAYKIVHHWSYNGSVWNIGEHWTYLLGCFGFILAIGALAYVLYLRRAAESAGRAMAFEKANFIIRFTIVIPLSLYLGIFLKEIAAHADMIWLIFGIVFASFLLHGIVECIFQFDIKGLLSKKLHLVITTILCLGFMTVFWFDIFGYDKFMPEANKVEWVSIDSYLFHNGSDVIDEWQSGISGEQIKDALAAIKDIKASTRSDGANYPYMENFTVTYKMKNGAVRRRQYSYYGKELPQTLDKLTASKGFKDDFCSFYHLDDIKYTSIVIYNGYKDYKLDVSEEFVKGLADSFIKDFESQTISSQMSTLPTFELQLEYKLPDNDELHYANHQIPANYSNTLDFIKEYNVVSFINSDEIKLENLEIHSSKFEDETRYVSDGKILNELKAHMLLSHFSDYSYKFEEDYAFCTLRYVIKGETHYIDVFIKNSVLMDYFR